MSGDRAHGERGPVVVVMGVSASGKSSVAAALAKALGTPWLDADDLHPASNIAKMRAGTPLTDDDRWPWLDAVGRRLAVAASGGGLVVACSALRRAYRDRLREHAPRVRFVHLTGSGELLAARSAGRTGHFMPPVLLASQLALLEPLASDEAGIAIDVTPPIADVAAAAAAWVRAGNAAPTAGRTPAPGLSIPGHPSPSALGSDSEAGAAPAGGGAG